MGRITHRKEGIPNHKLQKNLQLNDKYLSNDGGDEGITIQDDGDMVLNSAGTATLFLKDAGGEYISGTGSILNVVGDSVVVNTSLVDLDASSAIYISNGGYIGGEVLQTIGTTGDTHTWYKGGNTNDYFRLTMGDNGVTTLATHDNDDALANLTINVDGDTTIDSEGTIVIDSSDKLVGIGNSSPGSTLELSRATASTVFEINSWGSGFIPTIKLHKSGALSMNTYGANSHTTASEELGRIEGWGVTNADDNTSDAEKLSCFIEFANDDASREGAVPGKIVFATTPNSDDSTPLDRMTIRQDGNVGIGAPDPESLLEVRGPATDHYRSMSGVLTLSTAYTDINPVDRLGQINFQAPKEASGTDAIKAGAAIWGEAEAIFADDLNSTAVVFGVNTDDNAVEKMRLTSAGNLGIGISTPTALLEVQQSSTGGEIAFKIDNNDTDEIAMSIEAANITEDVIDITAHALTTSYVLDISASGLTDGRILDCTSTSTVTDGGSSNLFNIYATNDGVGTQTSRGIYLDYNKSAITADTKTSSVKGLVLDMDDSVNNVGTAKLYGAEIDVNFSNAGDGATTTYGLDITVGGADNNYAALFNGGNVGIGATSSLTDPDAALEVLSTSTQLKLSYDTNDYFKITVNADGHTTMINNSGSLGNINIEPKNDLAIKADQIKLWHASTIACYLLMDETAGLLQVQNGAGNTVIAIDDGDRNLYFYDKGTEYIGGNGNDLTIRADRDIIIRADRGVDFLDSTVGFTAQEATGDGTTTIDWQTGNKFHLLLAASTNETITFGTNPGKACNLLLKLKQPASGAGCTVDWALTDGDPTATLYWVGGGTEDIGEPTLSTGVNDVDIITFYYDGVNYYGVASLGFDA